MSGASLLAVFSARPVFARFRAIVPGMSFKALSAALAILLCAGPVLAQGARPASPPAAAPASGLIDLNSASRDDLMSLDGIGEGLAEALHATLSFHPDLDTEGRVLLAALEEYLP